MFILCPLLDPSCDFEKGLCKWKQSKSDEFDWTRKSGGTPSGKTGPSSGRGGSGEFIITRCGYDT